MGEFNPEPHDETEKSLEQRAIESLNQLGLEWNNLENKKTLEVGAGMAQIAEAAKQKGIQIISLDINPELHEWHEKRKIPDVRYVKADALKMPFADESFDMIISNGGPPSGLEGKEDVIKTLEEFQRVLKKGGEARFLTHLAVGFEDTRNMQHLSGEEMVKYVKEKSVEFLGILKSRFHLEIHQENQQDPLWQSVYSILKK